MKKSVRSVYVFVLAVILSVFVALPAMAAEKSFEGKVDIGGYSLYAKYTGVGEKPTIIFESAYGEDHTYWTAIATDLNNQGYRTLMYDRAGLGLSDNSPLPRTVLNQTTELHKLLEVLHIKGPYILVGHSLGAFNVRVFAAEYPNEVKGVVLCDGTPDTIFPDFMDFLYGIDPSLVELYQASFTAEGSYADCLLSAEQVTAVGNSLQKIPLIILSGTNQGLGPEFDALWLKYQTEFLNLSSDSKQILLNSGHYIPVEQPQAVIDSIVEMVNKVTSENE